MTIPAVSFEVFPPKTVDAAFKLWDTAQALAPLAPRFFRSPTELAAQHAI